MGFSLAWCAVRGKGLKEIGGLLGLDPTGTFEDVPESDYSAATLDGDWTLIVADRSDAVASPEQLKQLSSGADVIAATVEEHVMFCSAEAWKDGRKIWSVVHSAEEGPEHLAESGSLPESYAALKAGLLEQQKREGAEADYVFEIPMVLARSITGFKHDETDVPRYEILKRGKPAGGFWSRLFGGT